MDAVEEVKSRLAIEEVIGQYVELKRSGRNFKGLSPFSNERTPSFMVSPEKQIWHDFSSGKGGNMFSFVMEVEGLDFKGALELLARKAGIDLDQYHTRDNGLGKLKERLYAAMELATNFYQKYFEHFKEPQQYIYEKRQFTKETASTFRLGYAPKGGTELLDFMVKRGFSVEELTKAGLVTRRYRGPSDMFRDRIMVPLADPQGRMIGFTARLLNDQPNAPKYINTPQTLLYDKSRHVFGLHLAKEAIRKVNYAVLAEGNLDVIASHQAGVKQVVATAGTALTEYQLKILSRFTPDIRLSFDADSAGVAATERSLPIASKVGVGLSVVTIPSGKDPDELIRHDPTTWQQVIESPMYSIDWLIERYKAKLDITTAQGKKAFSDVTLAVIDKLSDEVEKEHYLATIANLLSVTKAALLSKLQEKPVVPLRSIKANLATQSRSDVEYIKTQNHLLALGLMRPELFEIIQPLTGDMFVEDRARAVLAFMRKRSHSNGDKTLVASLRPLEEYVKILSLLYEELYKGVETAELRLEAERLRAKLIERYVKIQKPALDQAIEKALLANETDSPTFKELHTKITELNTLRKKYK